MIMNSARTAPPAVTHHTTTRHVGNCQICEGDFKLTAGDRMVHHGYARPGWGHIVGDCMAVNAPPYEVSCDLIGAHRANVEQKLEAMMVRLEKLQKGLVTYVRQVEQEGGGRNKKVATVEYVVGVTEGWKMRDVLKHQTRAVANDIQGARREIERCTRRIEAWRALPVRTVEEEVRREEMARSERAKIVADKRAAKAAKEAAVQAKREALEAKRTTIREDFEAQFRAMVYNREVPAARELLAKLDKTKYRSWLSRHDLQCEEAFVALGLAVQDGVNGGRPYLRWL